MGITRVTGQVVSGTATSVTSLTLTFPNNPATGNLVVGGCAIGANNSISAADANSNNYAATPSSPSTFVTGGGRAAVLYLQNAPANASKSVTFTIGGIDQINAWIREYTGAATSNVLETDAEDHTHTGTAVNFPTITTVNDGDLLFAVAAVVTTTTSANSPWSGVDVVQGGDYAEDFIQSIHGAQAINFTQSGSGGWSAIEAAFKAAPSGMGQAPGYLFTPTRGPTRGLSPTWAFPPGPPGYGLPTGFLFTPPRGPTRGLRPTQAYPVVVVSTVALSGLSAIMVKGRAGPSGTVPLAGQSAIEVMARAAETGALPLAGRSAIEVMARAAATGTLPLAGRSAIDVMARAAPIGTVPLAGRSAIEVMARGVVLPAIFLSGRTSLQVKGLAAVPSLPAALAGRSAIDIMARAAATGTVPLSGLSAVETMARGVVIPAVFLAGRSQLQVKGAASPALTAALAGRSAAELMARAGASGAVLLAGRSSEIATALATLTTSQPGTIPARGFIGIQGRGILSLTQPPAVVIDLGGGRPRHHDPDFSLEDYLAEVAAERAAADEAERRALAEYQEGMRRIAAGLSPEPETLAERIAREEAEDDDDAVMMLLLY